tara:strand:+ start:261 stop:764 length:504 start_codon:yes stop_codon:yes gene_type:complete
MDFITTTRFNNKTLKENEEFRIKHNFTNECIYGAPVKIKDEIPSLSNIYVIEMNNDKNQIIAIGLVKNCLRLDKNFNIYQDGTYNRFIYSGKLRITREELVNKNKIIIDSLEKVLFKGYTHVKRGHGIQILPLKHQISIRFDDESNLVNFFKNIFKEKKQEIKCKNN